MSEPCRAPSDQTNDHLQRQRRGEVVDDFDNETAGLPARAAHDKPTRPSNAGEKFGVTDTTSLVRFVRGVSLSRFLSHLASALPVFLNEV